MFRFLSAVFISHVRSYSPTVSLVFSFRPEGSIVYVVTFQHIKKLLLYFISSSVRHRMLLAGRSLTPSRDGLRLKMSSCYKAVISEWVMRKMILLQTSGPPTRGVPLHHLSSVSYLDRIQMPPCSWQLLLPITTATLRPARQAVIVALNGAWIALNRCSDVLKCWKWDKLCLLFFFISFI